MIVIVYFIVLVIEFFQLDFNKNFD